MCRMQINIVTLEAWAWDPNMFLYYGTTVFQSVKMFIKMDDIVSYKTQAAYIYKYIFNL